MPVIAVRFSVALILRPAVVEPGNHQEPRLAFHQRRRSSCTVAVRKISLPVAGDVTVLILSRSFTSPVPGVATVTALDSVFLIAEMLIHLDLQPGLEKLLRELPQQAVRADQIDPISSGLLDQPLSNGWIDRRRKLQHLVLLA